MLLLLRLNGYELRYSQQELIDLGFGLAAENLNENDIRKWIKEHQLIYLINVSAFTTISEVLYNSVGKGMAPNLATKVIQTPFYHPSIVIILV